MVEFSTSYPQVFHRLDLTWGGAVSYHCGMSPSIVGSQISNGGDGIELTKQKPRAATLGVFLLSFWDGMN